MEKMNTTTAIVVCGNNPGSWMLAVGLSRQLSSMLKQGAVSIKVISPPKEAEKFEHVLVGNPGDRDFFSLMGFSENELLAECDGQFSWGFKYIYGNTSIKKAWYCFGDYGFSLSGIPFQHLWKKYNNLTQQSTFYEDFSLAAQCAKQNKFCHPQKSSKSMLAGLDYALNLDAQKFIDLLKQRALQMGVQVFMDEVAEVHLTPGSGEIEALELQNGQKIEGNLYIDTSRERRVYKEVEALSEENGKQGYVFQARRTGAENIETSTASMEKEDLGWLQTSTLGRNVNYVFTPDNDETDPEKCKVFLSESLNVVSGQIETLQVFPSLTKPWIKNVIGFGSAACSIPGLCVSATSLAFQQLKILLELIPGAGDIGVCSQEYNRRANILFKQAEEVRSLHKILPMIEDVNNEVLASDNYKDLMHRIQLFSERGRVAYSEVKVLGDAEWAALLIALGVIPEAYDPILEKHNFTVLEKKLNAGRAVIMQITQQIPAANEYRIEFLKHTIHH